MKIGRYVVALTAVTVIAVGGIGLHAGLQEPEHGVTPAEIERGGQTFLASCASCHGADGDLLPTANLATGTFRRATTDQELSDIIRLGIPGTAMPPNNLSAAQAALVVAYLRSLPAALAASKASGVGGNAANGQVLYNGKGKCSTCHLIQGVGGFLGPDLSSVGLTRRVAELERALIDPNADIRTGARTAKVVTRDGATIIGRLLNQDTYSLQLIDATGRLLSFQKDGVRQWEIMATSAMPGVDAAMLTRQEVADIVSYLQTLTTPVPGGAGGRGGAGRGGPAPAGPGAPGAGPAGRGGAQ